MGQLAGRWRRRPICFASISTLGLTHNLSSSSRLSARFAFFSLSLVVCQLSFISLSLSLTPTPRLSTLSALSTSGFSNFFSPALLSKPFEAIFNPQQPLLTKPCRPARRTLASRPLRSTFPARLVPQFTSSALACFLHCLLHWIPYAIGAVLRVVSEKFWRLLVVSTFFFLHDNTRIFGYGVLCLVHFRPLATLPLFSQVFNAHTHTHTHPHTLTHTLYLFSPTHPALRWPGPCI